MRRLFLPVLFVLLARLVAVAGEGMWLPFLIGQLNEADMRSLGMKMSAEDIYSVNKSSLKDAICRFNGGCSASIISPEGLLLTNHHCGYSVIQSHSTLENNYVQDGFWAQKQSDELPNENLVVTFIERIEDVTDAILKGISDEMTDKERKDKISQNIQAFRKAYTKKEYEDLLIKPFFYGRQYILFVTVTYRDVRLVGAPPSSIGKFGADTDNWEWPRHSGDFSLFRVYADADNLPADFSYDNQPLRPRHFLPISLDGVEEGDFTLVYGFPGRTNEYLPSFAVRQIQDVLDPARIQIRERALGILDEAMRADPQVRLQYTAKYARIANYWKKWIGERTGLIRTGAVDKKNAAEAEFIKRIKAKPQWQARYGNLLTQMQKSYTHLQQVALYREYYHEIFFRHIEIFKPANSLRRLLTKAGDKDFDEQVHKNRASLEHFYKDYRPELDRKVFRALIQLFKDSVAADYYPTLLADKFNAGTTVDQLTADLYDHSILTKPQVLYRAIDTGQWKRIQQDPAYRLFLDILDTYRTKIAAPYGALKAPVDSLQRQYMAALMEVFPDKKFYPDANGTMRVAYGQVKGYQPRDGVYYVPQTYLDGVIAKYVPGDYEFDLPRRLLDLYKARDYGPYADKNGKLPVNFLGSNHTTGGNSGSAVIDAYGNLIGLNFDRVWEGTMSDLYFDESICRNIMVDIRYVVWIMDKYAHAQRLVHELKFVHPKQAHKKKPWEKTRKKW